MVLWKTKIKLRVEVVARVQSQLKLPRYNIITELYNPLLNLLRVAGGAYIVDESLGVLSLCILLVAKKHHPLSPRLSEHIIDVDADEHLNPLSILQLLSQLEVS